MIFDRAQLRERYTLSSSLIDCVDGGGSRSNKARDGSWRHSTLLGGSMGPVAWGVIGSGAVIARACGETGGRETGHGTRGTWAVDFRIDIVARAWL